MAGDVDEALGLGPNGTTWQPPATKPRRRRWARLRRSVRRRLRQRRTRVALLLVVLLVLAAGAYGGYRVYRHEHFVAGQAAACDDARAQLDAEQTVTASATGSPTVAFFGDSFVAGVGASSVDRAWPALLAKSQGWKPVLLGHPGSGFLNDGPCDDAALGGQLATVVASAPATVFVSAGNNDAGFASQQQETQLATDLLTSLKTQLPNATLVLVGPLPVNTNLDVTDVPITAALRAAATAVGVQFVDPAGGRWFGSAADRGQYIADDGNHPNDAGHAVYAEKLRAAIGR